MQIWQLLQFSYFGCFVEDFDGLDNFMGLIIDVIHLEAW
jgi:hypothetical protein